MFICSHFPLEPFYVSLVSTPQLFNSFPSFTFFRTVTPGYFIAFLCSINERRFLSVYWAEIDNFNDNELSEDRFGVVSCILSILKTRGTQVPGARSNGRLNFVQWHLWLVGSVFVSNFMPPLTCREVWCEPQTFSKILTLVECKTGRWRSWDIL